ncbi:hypothetical protein NDU88_005651 [Pleurodeles waltl]|uniref:Uncharacterized protein n=1 Tax=Pleurodeles waltl TaxID=8319 RepID=A0AAV7LLT2_PLEWA|nr:hypothetical protein NDU88_005651 [Pleurodeles waltl]
MAGDYQPHLTKRLEAPTTGLHCASYLPHQPAAQLFDIPRGCHRGPQVPTYHAPGDAIEGATSHFISTASARSTGVNILRSRHRGPQDPFDYAPGGAIDGVTSCFISGASTRTITMCGCTLMGEKLGALGNEVNVK